jgi:hypothetical protein
MGLLYYGESHSFFDKAGQRRDFIENNAMDKVQFRQVVEQRAWPEGACVGGAVLFTNNQWDEGFFAGAGVYSGESGEGWACRASGGVVVWQFISQATPTIWFIR